MPMNGHPEHKKNHSSLSGFLLLLAYVLYSEIQKITLIFDHHTKIFYTDVSTKV